MKQRRAVVGALLLSGLVVGCTFSGCTFSGCTGSGSAGVDSEPPAGAVHGLLGSTDCDPLPGRPRRGGTIIFALADSVNPGHAPLATNCSEQVVFGNLYETLVNVDCAGRLLPGLATTWRSFADGRRWIFTLREARFWDGTPVVPEIVMTCWAASGQRLPVPGRLRCRLWFDAPIEKIEALDTQRLQITLTSPRPDFPYLLAHRDLAVAIRRPGWIWPVGSGPCRIRPSSILPVPDLRCLPNVNHPGRPAWDELVFRVVPGCDPRDLLGAGCDALVVRDRTHLAYFSGMPGIRLVPLPWDRIYLLLCPTTGDEAARVRWRGGWRRDDLAGNVVTATARAVDDLFFIDPFEHSCAPLNDPLAGASASSPQWDPAVFRIAANEIVFPADDGDGQRLAYRLAATAARQRAHTGTTHGSADRDPATDLPRATGLDRASFAFAVQGGLASAYVLPLQRRFASPCLQLSGLIRRARWLQDVARTNRITADGETEISALFDSEVRSAARVLLDTGTVTPLVATRPVLVNARPLVGLRLAHDGTLLLNHIGLSAEKETLP